MIFHRLRLSGPLLGLCFAMGLAFVVAGLQPGCATHQDAWNGLGGPPRIVVTFPPLVSFVRAVTGNSAGIICLCTTTGPHDYPYNVKEIIALREANYFLANGLELDDSFADKLNFNVNDSKLRYIKLGDNLPKSLLQHTRHDLEEVDADESKHGHEHEHKHGEYDPHVWLGIPQAKKMVEQIRDLMKEYRPLEKEYDRNTNRYLARLDALQKKGREMLAGKKIKLVTRHESLGYFASTYGLEITAVIQGNPGDTPTNKQMMELVNVCKKNKVRFIAVEPQYEDKPASVLQEALHKEKLDVKLIPIDPLETVDLKKDKLDAGWYERKIMENLTALAEAVQ